MNIIYMGKPTDLNVGNGKSVSVIGEVVNKWLEDETKTIYSNIKLKKIPYIPFEPENIRDVLNASNSLIILDELHSIVHKNHKISEGCNKHSVKGLCYRLSEFFRYIRKKGNDSFSTCQTFQDAHYQYRTLMQQQILCEKYNLSGNRLLKCNADRCEGDHRHYIKQKLYRNFMFVKDLPLFDPEPYYEYYDSYEIIDGWVSYD